jgi:hypothetical protein
MSLKPKKKLQVLAEVVKLYQIFSGPCAGDTGVFHGDDTGAAIGNSSRTIADKCRAILNANTEHASEGWYISASAMLASMGA